MLKEVLFVQSKSTTFTVSKIYEDHPSSLLPYLVLILTLFSNIFLLKTNKYIFTVI